MKASTDSGVAVESMKVVGRNPPAWISHEFGGSTGSVRRACSWTVVKSFRVRYSAREQESGVCA